ncbi:hypothetical protein BDB00DRAFT_772809, partial [Zychaea mexicana]|uniref:uncharacterized protein n=1 Tax=Zychaea mexicana TaxID=64656 RepID=UPI0022FE9C62
MRFKDRRVVVEITPATDEQRRELETHGLKINNHAIFGTPAIRKGSGFLTVNLYDLPHVTETMLSSSIQTMLGPYSKILDISLFRSAQHGFFMGQGCVSMDVTHSDQPLFTHTLPFPDFDDHFVCAFWDGSPPYCRICRGDTHEKEHCPKAKSRHVQGCSRCGIYGHTQSSC